MSRKRANVRADPGDRALIKEAAARRGIGGTGIIRQGIHLAAMANRVWDEPLFSRTFEGPGRTLGRESVRGTVAEAVRRAVRARHRALVLGLADAVNVALAADHDTDLVLTLDRRDFRAVRPPGRPKCFRLLPDDLPLWPCGGTGAAPIRWAYDDADARRRSRVTGRDAR
jgi:hypothetical protein